MNFNVKRVDALVESPDTQSDEPNLNLIEAVTAYREAIK